MLLSYNRVRQRGFSLIELIVVVAIIAILAAVAYPSYLQYVTKSKRSDATASLLIDAHQVLERCYSSSFDYTAQSLSTSGTTVTATACSGGAGATCTGAGNNGTSATLPQLSQNGYYTLSTCNVTASTYSLKMEPTADGPQVNDEQCTSFTIDNTGSQTSTGTASTSMCWSGHN